jgi:hypothetical protein
MAAGMVHMIKSATPYHRTDPHASIHVDAEEKVPRHLRPMRACQVWST